MQFELWIFYLISAAVILSSVFVVFAKQPLHSILFLVMAFIASAGLWILLHAEFLALILVLVYVGAVMTLFLFVVMMLNLGPTIRTESYSAYLIPGLAIVALICAALFKAGINSHFSSMTPPIMVEHDVSNTSALGMVLYTTYLLPFEIAAVILLVAIISAIMLTHRGPRRKHQNIRQQLAVERQKDIRVVAMPPEKPEGNV